MDDSLATLPGRGQPSRWLLCFKRTSVARWVRWLAMGRYKHVSCFGRVGNGWVFVDFGLNACLVAVVDDRTADGLIAHASEGARVLEWVPPLVVTRIKFKPIFVCTSLVAHLTGVPSSALRPDRFLKDCLAAGAKVLIHDDADGDNTARPGT